MARRMRASTLLLLGVLLSGYLSDTRAASQNAPSPEPAQNVGSNSGVSESHHGPTDAIVFLVVALLLGVFTQHVLQFTRIPYTNLLLVEAPMLNIRPCTVLLSGRAH